jgi:hypothetical protein
MSGTDPHTSSNGWAGALPYVDAIIVQGQRAARPSMPRRQAGW